MKNLLVVVAISFAVVAQSCEQESKENEAPEKVRLAFKQKFPDVKKVEWEKENETEWEAEFELKGIEYSANFNADGTWIETEHELATTEIPSNILDILNQKFENYKIKEAEIAELISGNTYEFEIEVNGKEIEVKIDNSGNLTQQEEKDEDGNDED